MNSYSVYFSPTRTTAAIAKSIQSGLDYAQGNPIDLTLHATEKEFGKDHLLVIAMPVYAGRLPAIAVERFRALKGNNTPVAAVVVYGNRAYDDALLELCGLCLEQGFTVAASAAFIGEHSFSSPEQPIAANRPDRDDLKQAEAFGHSVAERLAGSALPEQCIPAQTPGNRPYKASMTPNGAAAHATADCTACGICATHCPTQAINADYTDPEKCIWCAACVKACPAGARKIALPKIQETAARLHQNCQTRREPEWFLA